MMEAGEEKRIAPQLGAEIRIEDDGQGIPPEFADKVFDPFFTTKEPGQGTGLGLNIVYRILTRYRGSILVRDTDGGGATFEVKLPLRAASSEAQG